MNKTELKNWLANAVDGGCSDAFLVLLNTLPTKMVLKETTIKASDLISVMHQLSKKWQKEIDKECSA